MGLRATEAGVLGFVLLLLATVSTPALAQSQAVGIIYCCDQGGQTICGDILPPACYGRAYREVNPSGTVRRYVPAPLTPAEAARRSAEENRLRAENSERLRQQRRDKALLDTYRSLDDLDDRRDREIAEFDRSIRSLGERESELLARHRELLAVRADADGGEAAAQLEEDLRRIDGEIVVQRSIIAAKLRERSAVLDRFAADRQRYLQLSAPASASDRAESR